MAGVPDLHELWVKLNRPGADKFRQELLKRGFAAPSAKELRENFLRYQSSKQLFAPPPKYSGHVYSTKIDSRWQADVMLYSQPSEFRGEKWTAALVVADIFSRYLWAELIRSPMEAAIGFRAILARAGHAPASLTTDADPGFKTGEFEKLLQEHHIVQEFRVGRNDLAVVDNAIGRLKRALAEHSLESGLRDWASRLQDAVAGFNEAGAQALYGSAPEDLRGDGGSVRNKELFFNRQYEESQDMEDNAQQIQQRAARVQGEGWFRVYNHKERLGRRVFDPRWSREFYSAEETKGAFVRDKDGDWHPTKEVLPIPAESTVLPEPPPNLNPKAQGLLQRYADRASEYLTGKEDRKDYASNLHKVLSTPPYNIREAVQLAGLSTKSVIASFVQAFPTQFKLVTSKKGGTSFVELRA